MSLIAKKNAGGDYKLPPEGNHVARCVRTIDLGTQRDEYKGKTKRLHKVVVGWELPNEKAVFDETRGEEPFLVSKKYTLALGERANLRRDLESWRGRSLTEVELEAFDISQLLATACMVNVIHRISKKGRKYASVNSITPLPRGMNDYVPEQVTPTVKYSIEDGADDQFELLPEFIQNEIMASEEWEQPESDGAGDAEEESLHDVNAELAASAASSGVDY
jgi:hypothetical protein